jgi:hypothetical protein
MIAGAAIGLAATEGSAAETLYPTSTVEVVRVGQPTPLAPAPPSASGGVTLPSRIPTAAPTRPPARDFIRYYPHWTVEVAGR